MSTPCIVGWERPKSIGRDLTGAFPLFGQLMEKQPLSLCVMALSDSDHAGCLHAKRTTSCAMLCHDHHSLGNVMLDESALCLAERREQRVARLSSCCLGLIGLRHLARDLGRDLEAHLIGDANAAAGIGARRGVGRVGHIETRVGAAPRRARC